MKHLIKRFNHKQIKSADRPLAWSIASALLQYPNDALRSVYPELLDACVSLPKDKCEAITLCIKDLLSRQEDELRQLYVQTFDFNRRADLHMTYHSYGDRRQRGIVLLRIKRAMGEAGVIPNVEQGDLPDFLPLLLEFAAEHTEIGEDLLIQQRPSLELVRHTLDNANSPWLAAIDLVISTLPSLTSEQAEMVQRLANDGPPEEAVGVEPYAPEDVMPGLDGIDLPVGAKL